MLQALTVESEGHGELQTLSWHSTNSWNNIKILNSRYIMNYDVSWCIMLSHGCLKVLDGTFALDMFTYFYMYGHLAPSSNAWLSLASVSWWSLGLDTETWHDRNISGPLSGPLLHLYPVKLYYLSILNWYETCKNEHMRCIEMWCVAMCCDCDLNEIKASCSSIAISAHVCAKISPSFTRSSWRRDTERWRKVKKEERHWTKKHWCWWRWWRW